MTSKVVAVCGPTACGKSEVADSIADYLSVRNGVRTPVIVVDSMQVYAGLETISNQARGRPAEMVSVVPLTERWTVASHAAASEALISDHKDKVVLDAGTGMYLNAILFDIEISQRVPRYIRERAEMAVSGEANERRASRTLELEMAGAAPRGSIWGGSLSRETTIVYLRPQRDVLDAAISVRSARIVAEGVGEARRIKEMQGDGLSINPSVLDAVGVRELLALVDGEISPGEAEERVSTRTRRLARRQMRWFDKLTKTLEGRAKIFVSASPGDPALLHAMHDTL